MAAIKDPVHGSVPFSSLELKLLDCPEMQRLRGVKQVAMAYLVYPGANHTRFEHSYGTMHLAGEISSGLGLNARDAAVVRAAGLLHDVGHGAFSHESEGVMRELTGKGHEEAGWEKIRKGTPGEFLEAEGFPLPEVRKAYFGEGIGGIVSFGLGADRMDYLLRDSYYTGVAYGVTDAERLIQTIRLRKGRLLVDMGGLEAAESLLIARFLMFSAVYYHHTVRIASAMLEKAIRFGIKGKAVKAVELPDLSDFGLLERLKGVGEAEPLVKGIDGRRLFKRALEVSMDSFPEAERKRVHGRKAEERLELEIARDAGVGGESVIVDFPPVLESDNASLRVVDGEREAQLEKVSDIVRAIGCAGERKAVIVACPGEHKERVSRAAGKVFSSL